MTVMYLQLRLKGLTGVVVQLGSSYPTCKQKLRLETMKLLGFSNAVIHQMKYPCLCVITPRKSLSGILMW